MNNMRSAELFAGCGGLAYGTAEAGFKHALVLEIDRHACATIEMNAIEGTKHFRHWPVLGVDVRSVDFSTLGKDIDLLSGGPPCQPFSTGGRHKGPEDQRNMWPEAIRALKELRPKAFLFENVRGLLRPAFTDYLEFIQLSLSWPELYVPNQKWETQLKKMRALKKRGVTPAYRVIVQAVNAADYGAAQKRHRAIIWGVRADIADRIEPLAPTHSREALIWSQRVTGEYWKRYGVANKGRTSISESDKRILKKLLEGGTVPAQQPWITVRDVISDLPRPTIHAEPIRNHRLRPGARIYAGHTGSSLDEPAKALKAGCHGVPGGENALVDNKGRVRYFTVREMIRLQGLPDNFFLDTTWASATKQLGNAVPVQMARSFARHIRTYLPKRDRSQ
jgi:DNA (cytosine-5)-methyltransferase 1